MAIILPIHLLQNTIDYLWKSTLIGKFSLNLLVFTDIKVWDFSSWSSLKDIFYIDLESKYFVALFDSKMSRDFVHKQKSWLCCGVGLFTRVWTPNFKAQPTNIHFYPYSISFLLLPLEY